VAEERRLRDRDQAPGHRGDQQQPVDERVVVVGDHDQRSARRQALHADDLHPVVEDRQQQAAERAEECVVYIVV
jgi:hypothetical protein